MKKILYSCAVIAMVCLFASCGKEKKADAFSFSGLVLVPSELAGQAISACQLDPKPVIMFDSVAMKFTGITGCNSMFGDYSVENNNISFLNVGVTRMMCDSAANALEVNMLNVINQADSFAVNVEQVSFFNDGQLLGVFKIKSYDCCSAHQGEAEHACANEGEEQACQGNAEAESRPACKGQSATKNEPVATEEKVEATESKAPVKATTIKANPNKVNTMAGKEIKAPAEQTNVKVSNESLPAKKASKEPAAQPQKVVVK